MCLVAPGVWRFHRSINSQHFTSVDRPVGTRVAALLGLFATANWCCHAHAGVRGGYPDGAGVAGSFGRFHDDDLHACAGPPRESGGFTFGQIGRGGVIDFWILDGESVAGSG